LIELDSDWDFVFSRFDPLTCQSSSDDLAVFRVDDPCRRDDPDRFLAVVVCHYVATHDAVGVEEILAAEHLNVRQTGFVSRRFDGGGMNVWGFGGRRSNDGWGFDDRHIADVGFRAGADGQQGDEEQQEQSFHLVLVRGFLVRGSFRMKCQSNKLP